MRIKVLQNFGGGVTNERRVLPGEYDANDERLCGPAAVAFMLETRAAVVIEDETPEGDGMPQTAPDRQPEGEAAQEEQKPRNTAPKGRRK